MSSKKGTEMAGTLYTQAYSDLRAALVSARNEAGLSQAQLAHVLGKPPSFVGKYELGERRIDVIELLVILRALDVHRHVLLDQLEAVLPDRLGRYEKG